MVAAAAVAAEDWQAVLNGIRIGLVEDGSEGRHLLGGALAHDMPFPPFICRNMCLRPLSCLIASLSTAICGTRDGAARVSAFARSIEIFLDRMTAQAYSGFHIRDVLLSIGEGNFCSR